MYLILIFLSALALSALLTLVLRFGATAWQVVDLPDRSRKIHNKAIPLLGGLALFFSYFLILYLARADIFSHGLTSTQLVGFFLGAVILVGGGVIDDIWEMKNPFWHLVIVIIAIVTAIGGGVVIEKVTNPFGSLLYFGSATAGIVTFVWLLGMVYTTKLLDGIDGLVAGLGTISGLIIFLFTMTTRYYQPDVGLMGLIFAGVCLGFWIFNFHPASIFLGEAGSLFVGFTIGVLAIISGGKIAIALLIMGIPIMDVIWTIFRRLLAGQNPFKTSDKKHLHHRFLDLGLNQRQTALIYYFFATIFGLTALFLQSRGKVVALGILVIIMVIIAFLSVFLPKKIKT